ncbi:MAG: phosphoenolpyruvate-utilizing N-terminal domain-containing protein, partial [Planctomycetota bacterium]
MQVKKGIAVSPGVSIAKAIVVGQEVLWVQRRHVADSEVDEEVRRLDQALQEAAEDIDCEIQRLGEEFKVPRQVLESHRDIVLDPGLRDAITTRIRDEKMT